MRSVAAAEPGRVIRPPFVWWWGYAWGIAVLVTGAQVVEGVLILVLGTFALWLLWEFAIKPWRRHRSFKVQVYGGADLTQLTTGDNLSYVFIEPRYETTQMEWVEVRLVKKKWPLLPMYEPLNDGAVTIKGIEPIPRDGEDWTPDVREQKNGWRCNIDPPARRGEQLRLNIALVINASRPTRCKLSFEYLFEYGRGYGRHTVDVGGSSVERAQVEGDGPEALPRMTADGPSFDDIASRDEWRVYEVAFLWHGETPPAAHKHRAEMDIRVDRTKDRLHRAIEAGELDAEERKLAGRGVTRYVAREDLRGWCEREGERPDFLFDDE